MMKALTGMLPRPLVEQDPAKLVRRIARLRSALISIAQACEEGRVCDDVAWFRPGETLVDYCRSVLDATEDTSDDQGELAAS